MADIQTPKRRGRPPKPKPEPLPQDNRYKTVIKREPSEKQKAVYAANSQRFKDRWLALKAKEPQPELEPEEEPEPAAKPCAKPKPRRQPAPPTDTETEPDEVHIVRKPRKPKKTIVYVSDDETSEEEEQPVTTKKSRNYSKKATLNAGLNSFTPPAWNILG